MENQKIEEQKEEQKEEFIETKQIKPLIFLYSLCHIKMSKIRKFCELLKC